MNCAEIDIMPYSLIDDILFIFQTIKDMNMLKRLLKQSEMDHYSLYR